ncbi:hypothetical protein E3N88_09824 [Mikania micrantha]|uniref:Reverse transcriptase/retrotransposon-derived protein RNase H-like domain-containing protein n=1 Tax=Mikania micrantha TaxID=192012 RepID=A0A5N6PL05_9ASTR|nr:hypothetical protein E3N88_09824 [Mikania micrantha]
MSGDGVVSSRDRGVRSLSRMEWEERWKKGLCYGCGQQFGSAHKCPEGKLRILLLGDDEKGASEGENSGLDAIGSTEAVETIPSGTCLALEQDGILADTGGAKTLRFDCSFSGIRIKLGDGYFVYVTERCSGLPIHIGSCTFVIVALVFETGNLDLILGMAWLQSLGEVLHDWQKAWMKFTYAGTQVLLQGISTTQTSKAALNQWLLFDEVPSTQNSTTLPSSLSTHPCLTSAQQHYLSLLLTDFASLFPAPSGLPPSSSHDHQILLKFTDPICVRSYRYPRIQKAKIERQHHQFKVNQQKCSFGQSAIDYLGHIIDGQGVAMDPKKLESVVQWPVPKTFKGLRGFLGLTGCYRKFICNYGGIAQPLTDLTKNDAFKWHSEALQAFDQLKHALVTVPVLALPDFTQSFCGRTLFIEWARVFWFTKIRKVCAICYQFDILYKPGRENWGADALSRRADDGEFNQAVSSPIWLQGAALIEEAKLDKDIQQLKLKCQLDPDKFPGPSDRQVQCYDGGFFYNALASHVLHRQILEFELSG